MTRSLEYSNDKRVYLDHNATTPFAEWLREPIQSWIEQWGNPSSIHQSGRGPKNLMRSARQKIASSIGAKTPLEIIFTSGGSESNNLALKGVLDGLEAVAQLKGHAPRKELVVSAVEHPSIMKTAEFLSSQGYTLRVIPVDRTGALDVEAYRELVTEKTALVSVMYANNETGNVFAIKKLAKWAHQQGALFHCDGVQALGKAYVNVYDWGVDLASFSAHKFYSLKGCGVLFVKAGTPLTPLIHGGGQERSRRAGTENVLSIVALSECIQHLTELPERMRYMQQLRDLLEDQVLAKIDGVTITGRESPRIPNTSNLIISGVDGESLLMNLDIRGYSVSTGAACSSGNPEPSPVLLAMGLSREEAQSSLRLSVGWWNSEDEILRFVDDLVQVVGRLRKIQMRELEAYGE